MAKGKTLKRKERKERENRNIRKPSNPVIASTNDPNPVEHTTKPTASSTWITGWITSLSSVIPISQLALSLSLIKSVLGKDATSRYAPPPTNNSTCYFWDITTPMPRYMLQILSYTDMGCADSEFETFNKSLNICGAIMGNLIGKPPSWLPVNKDLGGGTHLFREDGVPFNETKENCYSKEIVNALDTGASWALLSIVIFFALVFVIPIGGNLIDKIRERCWPRSLREMDPATSSGTNPESEGLISNNPPTTPSTPSTESPSSLSIFFPHRPRSNSISSTTSIMSSTTATPLQLS